MPPFARPPKIPVTVTPTPAHPNLPPIYQTGSLTRTRVLHTVVTTALSPQAISSVTSTATHRLQQNGQAVLHLMEIVDGTVSYDRVVSNQLGADAGDESSREVKCLTECRGRSDLYNCLVKCILSPCETLGMFCQIYI